ncbi:MAG: hemolysin III family protein [bacterium]
MRCAAGYSRAEEIASSLLHGIGLALSLLALAVLVTFAALHGDVRRVISFSIYGTTLALLYFSSTMYHGTRSAKTKRIFRVLDHSAIFLLIAGSYTPFTLVKLGGGWGWSLFGIVWGLAVLGICLEVFRCNRTRPKWPSMVLYVGMGWLMIVAAKPLAAAVPTGGLVWLGIGGLAYTSGLLFYAWKRLPFSHSIWHLFVLAGSACHFLSIFLYVLPMKGA